MNKKQVAILVIVCLVASFMGAFAYKTFFDSADIVVLESDKTTPSRPVSSEALSNLETGFISASKESTSSVVFIKTESQQYQRSSFFWGFDPFGRVGKVASTGSGVIITKDGYIVTNQHVIKNADKIEVVVTESKKTYAATLVGADPSSDLALLKIETNGLNPIEFANSDQVEIGQWVLAVGNPFNLNSTVTAGIVSAKGRNINIVNNQFPIESFIQTDAAINPGNSGGALVDLTGKLVGVNTAIASKTGSYVGYGFAIPSNIVSKIIEDLKNYGEVQRGFIGLDIVDIDGDISEKLGVVNGVMIKKMTSTNAEAAKKLEVGDVITKMDGVEVGTKAAFDEQLAYKRPGDVLKIEVYRYKEQKEYDITLVNKEGTTALLTKESIYSEKLGAEFELISKIERDTYKINSGVKVLNVSNGTLRQMSISQGFIFTKVNNKVADDVRDLIDLLENYKGQVRIEGIGVNGQRQYLSFSFR